ncbi:MAG TPA: hypothetical protein VGA41_05150 [Candidatus Dormibacteraeota bacterium]
MAAAWGASQRRALVGLAMAVAIAASWAAPTLAAGPKAGGNEIAPVGHPNVVVLSPQAQSPHEKSKKPAKPFLSANPEALARAKARADAQVAPATTTSSPGVAPSTPATGTGLFNGLNQPGISAADEGYCCTPPDTTGAVGPNNYVEFVNTTIRVSDRSLKQLSQLDMGTFVAAPAGLNVSDPQVQWDPRAGRWFYAAIAFATHNNYLVFGWSKTSDPSDLSGGWCRFGAFTGNQLPDYPKLGHDDNFVLFGANLYDDTTGNFVFNTAAIWALPKPANGSTACTASGFTAFADAQHPLRNADGTSAFTPVPVNMSDASSVGYVLAGHSPLAPKPTDPNGPQTRLMVWHVALQGGNPRLIADGDLTVGSFDVPASVPQPGGPTVDSLDARLTQAVGHADPDAAGAEALWTQHTINGPGGRSVLRWYEILPAGSAVRQQGQVQSATDFIWNGSISPSIAGNDAAVFYNRGGSSQLAMAAAQSRISSTPLSTLSGSEVVLAISNTPDVDFSCTSPYGPPCRWGDYSGASPDPNNPGVVWGSNQVNGPSFFGYPQWATQNYAVTTSGTPPPPPPPPTPCTAVAFAASPASPQAPGVSVNLTGAATGCPNPVYQFWILPPGGSWTILQAYSSSAGAVWNTTGQPAGTYSFDIWAKQSGSSADWEAHVSPNPTYTLQTPPPPNTCTAVTWNPPSPASPQVAGVSVQLGGTATGCPNPVYQFWIQPPGGQWTILQAYSSSAGVAWNTTGQAAGTYLFDVWAKQSGSSASFEANISPNPTYTLQAPPICTAVTWNAPSPASPQAPGVSVNLGGTATGCPNPVYEFWIQPPGGSWTILQAYSSSSTVTWNTAGQPAGTYLFDVWAKQSGSTASWEAHVSPNPTYTLQAPPPPATCTAVTWNAPSPASPQAPGVSVNLGGTAAGCPNPVYQFYIQPPGGSWTILQAYSPSSTVSWNTAGLGAGTYLFDVWAKQSGSSASYEAHISPNPTYTLQAAPTCTAVTWNAPSPASPQSPGVSVTLSGAATGCPNPVYQFWIQAPGGSWTILQAYSSSSSVSWNTAGQPTGTYLFDVWARQSGSSASWEAHVSPNPTYTLQTAPPCTSVTMTATPASPQTTGTSVQLSATSTGCSSPQYEFWIQGPGGAWTIVQGYSSSSTFNWSTAGLPPGTYNFDVWVRQSGSTASWEAHISPNPTYTLNP